MNENNETQPNLLAAAVSHLGEGVLITNADLEWPGPHTVFVNEAMCQISGYATDELIGQSPRILQGDGSNRETLDWIKAELAAGRSCLAELVNYRKDGTPYDAELFITPLRDAEGRHTNFVSIHRDISNRKKAERDLREREERLRAIFDAAINAIITINQQGIIIALNDATESMFGYSKDELLGKNVGILMPSPYHEEHDGYISRYLKTGEARIIGTGREVVARRKDGSTFPIDLSVSQVDHLGLFMGVIHDISARKDAEESLRREHELSESITNTAQNIVLVLDTNGCIVRFNPFMEELTGWRLDEVQGRNWFDTFLPEHNREQIRSLFGRAIGGQRTRGNVNTILTKDERELEIEWYDAPLTSSNGELIGLLCTGLDVTERRMLEREILEIAAEEQRRIGQDLHDSTQQQLTGLSLLAKGVAEAMQKLNQATAESEALRNLEPLKDVNNLEQRASQVHEGLKNTALEVTQLAHGLIPVELDAEGLRSALSELTRGIDAAQHVTCEFRCDGPVEVANNFVATHLYRIAQEAVNNALKHSEADRIEISLSNLHEVLTLQIVDNGTGVDDKRVDGPGMGLRIMAYRADLIGATLDVGRAEGGGTEVVCKLGH